MFFSLKRLSDYSINILACKQTALQVYVRTYKQAPTGSHSLLRKAERLDQLMGDVRLERGSSIPTTMSASDEPLSAIADDDPSCAKCRTKYSPLFHPSPENASETLCHACFFRVAKMEREKEGEKKALEEPMAGVEAAPPVQEQQAKKPRPEVVDVVMAAA